MNFKELMPLEALKQVKATICIKGGISGYELTYIDIIEKSIKALEIIKEKRVNVNQFLKHCSPKNKWGYNKTICDKKRELTQEEYDLLKEILL